MPAPSKVLVGLARNEGVLDGKRLDHDAGLPKEHVALLRRVWPHSAFEHDGQLNVGSGADEAAVCFLYQAREALSRARGRRSRPKRTYPESLRQTEFVVQVFGVVGIRLLGMGRDAIGDSQQFLDGGLLAAMLRPFVPLAESHRHGAGKRLPCFSSDFFREPVCFGVLNIQAHAERFLYPSHCVFTVARPEKREKRRLRSG